MSGNDERLRRLLEQSVDERARRASVEPDVDDLFVRVQRRNKRQRRALVGSLVFVLVVGIGIGVVVGRSMDDDTGPDGRDSIAAAIGVPPVDEKSDALAPPDVDAARAAVIQTFHEAYDGTSPNSVKIAASQRGERLSLARQDAAVLAQRFGYTAEQLAGTTVRVLDVDFIDETHAAVRFTITIPGHGDVLVDRIGFAVVDDARWKVASRTQCDLLSLNGVRLPEECLAG